MAKATLVQRTRSYLREGVFVEVVVWQVPASLRGSNHEFKYSMSACCGMTTKPEKAITGISVRWKQAIFQRYRPASGRFHCRRERMAA
jgi:hypothetical protein